MDLGLDPGVGGDLVLGVCHDLGLRLTQCGHRVLTQSRHRVLALAGSGSACWREFDATVPTLCRDTELGEGEVSRA